MDIQTLIAAKAFTARATGGMWEAWDESTTYTEGQIVMHENAPYQCKEGGSTAGSWIASEWELVRLSANPVSKSADSTVSFTLGCDADGFYITY